jgi:nucleoside-diphosphate-sugar epimerase
MTSLPSIDAILAQAKKRGEVDVDRNIACYTLGYISGKAFANSLKVGQGKTICVTGASGFIASHCVSQLLAAGYTVHGTVRSLSNPKKVSHLTSLPFANQRLKLFEADLLKENSFDEAVEGCNAVLHTASPFIMDKSLTENDFCAPAIQGTLNVLNSMKKFEVKICILTSSTAAIYCYTDGGGDDHIYTEADWSNVDKLRATKTWYALSKTLAEREAHKFAKDNDIILKSCNPTYVLGPRLQPTINESTKGILNILNGTNKKIRFGSKCICDVRDVARAHVLAYQKVIRDGPESVPDRIMIITECPTWTEIVAQVAVSVPTPLSEKVRIPTEVAKEGFAAHIPLKVKFECVSAQAIGLEFTPWTKTITDMVTSIAQCGDLDNE